MPAREREDEAPPGRRVFGRWGRVAEALDMQVRRSVFEKEMGELIGVNMATISVSVRHGLCSSGCWPPLPTVLAAQAHGRVISMHFYFC